MHAETEAERQARRTKLGDSLASGEPLLLVPLNLGGLPVASAEHDKGRVGVHASWTTPKFKLVGFVNRGRDQMDKPDKGSHASKVHGHDAVVGDDGNHTAFAEWRVNDWFFVLDADYRGGAARQAALKLVSRAAEEWAKAVDPLLSGTALPSAGERNQALATLQVALSKTATKSSTDELHQYLAALKKAGIRSDSITDIALNGDPNTLIVTVTSAWHNEPKGVRLDAATSLWKLWAAIHNPEKPDRAFLKIVDESGEKVGGSGWVGSSIDVEDE